MSTPAVVAADDSGCTCVAALVVRCAAAAWLCVVASTGDSRAVLCRGGRAVSLTVDHKVTRPDEHSRLACGGAMIFFGRLLGRLAVSRAIGDHSLREGADGASLVVATPEAAAFWVSADDAFLLLACDGVFDVVRPDEAVATASRALLRGASADAAARDVVQLAVDRRSEDNVSVIIVLLHPATGLGRATPTVSPVHAISRAPVHSQSDDAAAKGSWPSSSSSSPFPQRLPAPAPALDGPPAAATAAATTSLLPATRILRESSRRFDFAAPEPLVAANPQQLAPVRSPLVPGGAATAAPPAAADFSALRRSPLLPRLSQPRPSPSSASASSALSASAVSITSTVHSSSASTPLATSPAAHGRSPGRAPAQARLGGPGNALGASAALVLQQAPAGRYDAAVAPPAAAPLRAQGAGARISAQQRLRDADSALLASLLGPARH